MKRFFIKVIETFESMGRARAANQLAQMGMYKEAKELMLNGHINGHSCNNGQFNGHFKNV